MKVKRVLSVGRLGDRERGVDQTRHLTAEERLSQLENLRIQICEVTQSEYPRRLQKVLEVVRRYR